MSALPPYPLASGSGVSAEFTAIVDGVPHHVLHHPGFSGGTVSWLSFDTDGPCTIQVTTTRNIGVGHRRFDRVEAIPAAAADLTIDGPTVIVRLRKPGPLVLIFDGDLHLPFHIFANPPVGEPPPDAIRFGPGVHRPGLITVGPGQTLWLDAGALVHGHVRIADAPGASIRGRGILTGAAVRHGGDADHPGPMLRLDRSPDVVVEGITILDSYAWTLAAWHCDGWQVRGIRILNERGWSTDGLNPVNCSNVLIEECFVRAKDDCISIKGLDLQDQPGTWTPLRDITVRNCVFWSTNNNAVVVGSETRASSIERIAVHDCEIVASAYTCGDDAAALAVIVLDDTRVHDIAFERIRIHHAFGPAVLVMRCDEIFRIPGSRRPEGGSIEGIRFGEVEVLGGSGRRSFIRGLGPDRRIGMVTFTDCVWHGRRVHAPEDMRLEIESAAPPRFDAGAFLPSPAPAAHAAAG